MIEVCDHVCPSVFCDVMFMHNGDCSILTPRNRWGRLTYDEWAELVKRVGRWYAQSSDEEIERLNAKEKEERENHSVWDEPETKKVPEPGYLYLVSGPDALYKLGMTRHPKARIAALEKQSPWPIDVVCVWPVADPKAVEGELKERFVDYRSNGEWYRLDAASVEYVRGLAE